MRGWTAHAVPIIFGLLLIFGAANHAEGATLRYKGTLVTGGPVGTVVEGTAVFPDDLPDLIEGGFEDWWRSNSEVAFSFDGNGIRFKSSVNSRSELRIMDGSEQDALAYEGTEGSTSLVLILTGGDPEALIPGSGGLRGTVPTITADASNFEPCTQTETGSYRGSCSTFATSNGAMLFNITELSVSMSKAGLLAAYGFEESAPGIAIDSSQQQNHGDFDSINGPQRVAGGRFGNALLFDGNDDWITVREFGLQDPPWS
jgi:hypothetical protein